MYDLAVWQKLMTIKAAISVHKYDNSIVATRVLRPLHNKDIGINHCVVFMWPRQRRGVVERVREVEKE